MVPTTAMPMKNTRYRNRVHNAQAMHSIGTAKEMAIAAVNEGRVFRILEKPLDEPAARLALRDALTLYRAQARERALHESRAMAMR